MTPNLQLCIQESAHLLSSLFPEEDWVLFLDDNLLGFTKGYSTIPFENFSVAYYDTEDLKTFAIKYGTKKLSETDICSRVDDYLNQTSLESVLAMLGDDCPVLKQLSGQDFLTPYACSDKDYFQLSRGEFFELADRLKQIHKAQEETAQTLVALAAAIRVFGSAKSPTHQEIELLCGIATNQAGRAYSALELTHEINHGLFDRRNDQLHDLSHNNEVKYEKAN